MVQTIDFRALFGDLPSPYMILDRNLRYVEVNRAYQAAVGRTREALIGHNIFDLFPNDGEGGRLLRGSFEKVLETRESDSIAYIPYPLPKRGGGFEMRYWSAVHTPLFHPDGTVKFIVQNTVDVTELHDLKAFAYGAVPPSPSETQLLLRAEEVQRENLTLLEETAQLRDLFMQAPSFMALITYPDLTFSLVNKAMLTMTGSRPLIGRAVAEAVPELGEQGFVALIEETIRQGEPFIGEGASVRLLRNDPARLEERFVDFVLQPVVTSDGRPVGIFIEGSDVTARVHGERQQKLLVDELNHRVKNTLATVQSIAAQTLRTSRDPKTFRVNFEARLFALSATHDLLTAASWRSAALRDVLLAELRPHGVERYQLDGPDISLPPEATLSLGLIVHELATNAAKYGALSNGEGRLRVAWRIEHVQDVPHLLLEWSETGGPMVAPPTRRGFGSRLIERSLTGDMGGEAALDFAEHGLNCNIRLPLRDVD